VERYQQAGSLPQPVPSPKRFYGVHGTIDPPVTASTRWFARILTFRLAM